MTVTKPPHHMKIVPMHILRTPDGRFTSFHMPSDGSAFLRSAVAAMPISVFSLVYHAELQARQRKGLRQYGCWKMS